MPPVIVFDARCLQDPAFRHRGVGQHAAVMIRGARPHFGPQTPRLVAMVSPHLPDLLPEFEELFDKVGQDLADLDAPGGWFVQLSPLTHSPLPLAGVLRRPDLLKASLFYDAIPFLYPDSYLRRPKDRLDYLTNTLWLGKYDTFHAISHCARDQLHKLLRRDDLASFVTGVGIREALIARAPPLPRAARSGLLVAAGVDWRKNVDVAVCAHARSALMRAERIPLRLFGGTDPDTRDRLRALHQAEGGGADVLEFKSHLSDEDLLHLYRSSIVSINPSFSEGFSIPVIEASASGTPLLASDIDAHRELVRDAQYRFDPKDADDLAARLEALVGDAEAWQGAQAAQADIWRGFLPQDVAARFWHDVSAAAARRAAPSMARLQRGARPVLSVIAPMPPTLSGVADYTLRCLEDLTQRADVRLFTDSPPGPRPALLSEEPITARAFTAFDADAVVSVMGNSHFHLKAFRLLMEYGGDCISHDVRMLDFYMHLVGVERARAVAERELKRPVTEQMVQEWCADPALLPVPLLSEMALRAGRFFVHSRLTRDLVHAACGKSAIALPFAHYSTFALDRLAPAARLAARARLGCAPDDLLVTTFGYLTHDKALPLLVWACDVLASWGFKAKLAFCGSDAGQLRDPLSRLARELDLEDRVIFHDKPVSKATYEDYLAASDAAVQLRTYQLGSLSGAIGDCIGAALPTIANVHLADAMDAPDFVRRVPDHLSAVLIAEQLAQILAAGPLAPRPLAAAQDYRDAHAFVRYNTMLLEHLDLAPVAAPRRPAILTT
ncbi:glycosyltransferase [Aquabacter sp. L1I39]|uniref:glycosyltransferase n=1 Tax=Aquabacter sp. L1I39 TaxID=2820278 RepID=UPI001AD993A3|nr:glycosyltransferase [Aquabacter sp. L1I39]QTL05791.1 glycosyltransferase [Aquabacter sp. L1I39]